MLQLIVEMNYDSLSMNLEESSTSKPADNGRFFK